VINENISSIDVHENETIHAVELEDDENDLFVSDLNQAAYDEEQIESEYVILDVDSVIDEMNDLAVADSFEEEAVDEEFVKKLMIDKLNALSKLGGIDTWSIASTNQSDINFVFVNFLIFVLNLILLYKNLN
jgi:hypothetical protein